MTINRVFCAATLILALSGSALAAGVTSGRYYVAPGSVVTATGGFAGTTRTLGFTGELTLQVDSGAGRASITSSALWTHSPEANEGLGMEFPNTSGLPSIPLTELDGAVEEDGSLTFTQPATSSQVVELAFTADDYGLLLDGFYVEPGADTFTYTFAHLRLWPMTQASVAGDTHLVLVGGRFDVTVQWESATATGSGRVASLPQRGTNPIVAASDDTGVFYFFSPDNWEMKVKVLDGCAINEHFWVFAASSTNVGYDLSVTDTWTDSLQVYHNPLGHAAPAITDTEAFATCDFEKDSGIDQE